MTCPRCGFIESDESKFCSKCGESLGAVDQFQQEEQTVSPPEQPGAQFVQPPPASNQYGAPIYSVPPTYQSGPLAGNSHISDYFVGNLILLILNVLLCCTNLFSLVLSIIGLVYSVGVRKAKEIGSIAEAESKAKTAKTMFIISLILFLVLGVLIGIVTLITGVGALSYFEEFMY